MVDISGVHDTIESYDEEKSIIGIGRVYVHAAMQQTCTQKRKERKVEKRLKESKKKKSIYLIGEEDSIYNA